MAYLINRNPSARIECLHALCKYLYNVNDFNKSFKMKDVKYDKNKINVFHFCHLLHNNSLLNIKYCPYKENPINESGCSLTNGIIEDSTKSKEVSNTVNSLDALGFIRRESNDLFLTELGKTFSESIINSKEYFNCIEIGATNYGVFVGFLAQLYLLNKDTFDTNEIFVGYPSTEETIFYNNEFVSISSGSESDSNTRTKSCLLAWATTLGYICPIDFIDKNGTVNRFLVDQYVLAKKRNLRKYKILNFPSFIFNANYIVKRPLSYKNLTKNTGALRENNQKAIRELTLSVESKIQNRRFAIIYALNHSFLNKIDLNVDNLIDFLINYEELFVVSDESFEDVIYSELLIAFMVGIPYKSISNNIIQPLNGLDLTEISKDIPKNLLLTMKEFKI